MRLINTTTGLFEEFIGRNLPKYTWIDTCCIDKSGSAELTEAINFMYRWYLRADICFVYLSDLPLTARLKDTLPRCRWFTRGWTLQELIAPANIEFFDLYWNLRGSKSGMITRIEDMAYCLLGIFNVHMHLIYGEEEKPFQRLQHDIIASVADLSVFGWSLVPPPTGVPHTPIFCGLSAHSSAAFDGCHNFDKSPPPSPCNFSVFNSGIKNKTEIRLVQAPSSGKAKFAMPIDCTGDTGASLGVYPRKCGPNQFYLLDAPLPDPPIERYFLTQLPGGAPFDHECPQAGLNIAQTRSHVVQIRRQERVRISNLWPPESFDIEDDCSVVDYRMHRAAIKELQAEIGHDPCVYENALGMLHYYKIPRTSAVAFSNEELHRDGNGCIVSFLPELVTDKSISQDRFWRMTLIAEVLPLRELPTIHKPSWRRGEHFT
ncbi:hypothetical protein B0T24DRAFT_690376 [Lasiosphaeria ovina]|uniref:Heterokaryon incompatibility domain-containing protein n=1 Tax=Lasiosphaeria ovina TaxID=92902 RepID=A0AAE0JUT9_9PEZI|nr:hypothetical protein B0T24DRAFT_690376 [Lasiosphaeria ovina]